MMSTDITPPTPTIELRVSRTQLRALIGVAAAGVVDCAHSLDSRYPCSGCIADELIATLAP